MQNSKVCLIALYPEIVRKIVKVYPEKEHP
jgi:hypothetical protein